MPKIADLRNQYEALRDLSDYEIVDQYAQQNGVSFETIAMDLGVEMPNKPGFGTSVKNSLYGLAQGVGQIGGDYVAGVENDNSLERFGREGTIRNPLDIMEGDGGAFSNLAGNLVDRPLNTIGQIAGQAVGLAAPGGLFKGGVSVVRGLQGLGALSKTGRAAQAGGEAALYGTTSYGNMRDQQEAQGDNTTEDKLTALLAAGAIGSVERFAGIESLIAGKNGAASTLGKTILRQGAGEAAEEIIQTPIEKFGANQEVFNMDTLDEAAAGGLAGFVGGGLAGPLAYQFGKKKELLSGANTEQEDLAEEKRLGLPNRPNDTMISFPDGSTGTQAQIDEYLQTIPEAQRINERARLSGLNDSVLPTNVAASETPEATATLPVQPTWAMIDPDTQTPLPTPKDVVGGGKKKVEAYTLVAQARTDGLIDQTQFEDYTNQIASTSKIGKILPRIQKSLGELQNGNVQNLQQTELQVQNEGQMPTQQESLPTVQEENVGQIDLAKIASQLAPQQLKIFTSLVSAANNNEIDAIISGDGKLQYQAIAERAGLTKRGAAQSAINQTIKKISTLAGFDVKQYLAERTNQVRTTSPAAETQVGLSPRLQTSEVESGSLFGDEDTTASMGMIKSVGATDTDQGSVVSNNNRAQDEIQAQGTEILDEAGALNRGTVITPEGDVTPSDNALAAAQANKEARDQYIREHPEYSNAINDWDNETISLADFTFDEGLDYVADYIETVDSEAFNELTPQQQTRVIEDLQVKTATTIKRRLFNEQPKSTQSRGDTIGRGATGDANARRISSVETPAAIEGMDRQNSGDTELGGEGAQTVDSGATSSRGSEGLASKGRALSTEENATGVAGALAAYEDAGLGGLLTEMLPITSRVIEDKGLFNTTMGGQFTVTIQKALLDSKDQEEISHVIRHELAHGLDFILGWNLSGHPLLEVKVLEDGQLEYVGAVAKEIDTFRAGKHNVFSENLALYLGYPLNRINHGELDAFTTEAELFAQLQSSWMTKEGKSAINRFLPKTAIFMEAANNHARNKIQSGTFLPRESRSKPSAALTRPTGNVPSGDNQSSSSGAETKSQEGLASRGAAFNGDYLNRAQSTGTDAWKKIGNALKDVAPKLLTSNQLLEQYGGRIPALKTYIKAQNEMGAMAMQLRQESSKLLEVWGTYAFRHKAQNAILMSVMHDATQSGIHPDVPFYDETNAHLTIKDLDIHTQLSRKYSALPEEARKIYQDSKALLSSNWKLRQEIFADVVTSAYDPRIEEANKNGDTKKAASLARSRDSEVKEHAKQIKELKGPYFPLLRFGDYIVIAESNELVAVRKDMEAATPDQFKELAKKAAELEKSGAHYVVEAFESRLDRDKRKEALTAKGFQAYERRAETYSQENRPVTAAALEKINDALTSGFDKTTGNKLKDLVTEMYVSSLPEHHALQRQIKRKGVAGADANMMRAFAETIERDSFYLSRMKFTKDLTKGLVDMRRETKRMGDDEQNVYNNVVDRATADYKYEHTPVLSALARLSSIFHLGISPAFLLTNMTQPWFISVPQLAGAHGATKTFAAMRSSWLDATKIIKQGKGGTVFNLADVDLSVITNVNERKMLERLRDVNKLDSTQLLDMGALSNGMSPVEMKGWKVFNWATHHIELTNRISTALATYRLEQARNPSATQETLIDKAINMVDLTQLDYSNENAAYFMKPGVGLGKLNKIVFQFRKYQQGMIYLLGRNAKLAFAGDKEAMRALGYLMGTQLLFAGTTGLPITAPLLFAAYAISGADDDEEGDLETRIRNYATDIMGADAARVFWKGLPTALGADLSSNIGMGGLFKPFPMMAATDVTDAKTGEDAIKELLFNAAGAPVGMISNMADGVISFKNGEYARGLSRMTPRFVASVIKANDLDSNGVATRSGTQVMTADQFDGWDITLKAAGFNPTAVSEHYTAQTSKENTSRAIQDRRNTLLKEYAVAKIKGEDLVSIKEDIRVFNGDHPKVKLDQSALIRATESRKKASSEVDQAGVRFRANESSLKGIDRFAY